MDFGLIIILTIIAVIFFVWLRKFKVPKIPAVAVVTGGVKCGKSALSVHIAITEFKRRLRSVKVRNFFAKLFKKPLQELPVLYSNVPLGVPTYKVTERLLTRQDRFIYGSVIYLQEGSLVCNSMDCKNLDLNEVLTLFHKLIGHETKGGCLIYDTQCIQDCHYSIKRCLSNYIYIHHLQKSIPFFLVAYVRECVYSDDGSIVNNVNEDIEESLRKVLIPKSIFKKYDCYCYSALTDNKKVSAIPFEHDKCDLKAHKVVNFSKSLKKYKKEVDNDNE